MEKPVTLRQLANNIGVKYTTLKHRVDPCHEFIPFSMDGKFKVYSKDGIEVIKHINQLCLDGKNINQILPILESQYDRQITIQAEKPVQTIDEQTPMSIIERQLFLTEQTVHIALNRQEELQTKLDQQDIKLIEQDKRIALLEQMVEQNNMTFWQWVKMKFGR